MRDQMVTIHKHLPTMSDVHNNTPLTNFSEGYVQSDGAFIASSIFPVIPVSKQSDLYYIWNRGDFNRDQARVRAPGTPPAGGGMRLTTGSYSAEMWEWSKIIPDEVRANSDPAVDHELTSTKYVMNALNIRKERIFATNYLGTSIWTTDITGVNSGPSSGQTIRWNVSTATPVADVETGKMAILLATGFMPNTLVLGAQVRSALNTCPDIVNRLNSGQTSGPVVVNDSDLARIFGVERVVVSRAIYNTAAEGAAESNAFIAGKVALLCYAAPAPGLMEPSAGYTFAWTGFNGASAAGTRIRNKRLDVEDSDLIVGNMAFDLKKISADLGYFFTSIIA
jgi:hypothetical protein